MSTVPLTMPASVAAAESALRDRGRRLVAPGLGDRVIVEFAAADDVRSGMARVVAMLRRGGGAGRVESYPFGLLTMIVSLEAISCRPS